MGSRLVNIIPSFGNAAWQCSTGHNEELTDHSFTCSRLGYAYCTINIKRLFNLVETDMLYSLPTQIKIKCITGFDAFLTISYRNRNLSIEDTEYYSNAIFIPAGIFNKYIHIDQASIEDISFTIQRVSEEPPSAAVTLLAVYLEQDLSVDIPQITTEVSNPNSDLSTTIATTVATKVSTPDTDLNNAVVGTVATDIATPDSSLNTSVINSIAGDITSGDSTIIQALNDAGYSPSSNINMRLEGSVLYITF